MQLDWITTLAQIVNFLVLVWLLQRFLFGPITRVIEERRGRIEDRLEEAEARRQDAEQAERSFRDKERELEERREALMDAAREEAQELKHELSAAAKEEVEAERESWRRELRDERAVLLDEFHRRFGEFIALAARRALQDLADADLEAQAAKRFADELKALDEDGVKALKTEIEDEEGAVVIESALELDASAKRVLTRLIHDMFGEAADVQYQTNPDLLLGMRLRAGTRSVEWSAAGLLDDLDDAFDQMTASGEDPASEKAREAA